MDLCAPLHADPESSEQQPLHSNMLHLQYPTIEALASFIGHPYSCTLKESAYLLSRTSMFARKPQSSFRHADSHRFDILICFFRAYLDITITSIP